MRLNARPDAGRWIGSVGMSLGLAVAAVLLVGCDPPWSSAPTADYPSVQPNELDDAGGRPCPRTLPTEDDPSGHGFGTEEPATEKPALLQPDEAWVCRYNPDEVRRASSGGAVFEWRRAGQPQAVTDADLRDAERALGDLELADGSRLCTLELGPRWMLVYSHDGDLTGVVVDDFGCRDVRLTDDPHTTPPGADRQRGTVGGVLDGGAEILAALGVGRPS